MSTKPEAVHCIECRGMAIRWEDQEGAGYQCVEVGCEWMSVDDEFV